MVTAHIVITGNPVDGFKYIGPFADLSASDPLTDSLESDWWVGRLTAPAGVDGVRYSLVHDDVVSAQRDLIDTLTGFLDRLVDVTSNYDREEVYTGTCIIAGDYERFIKEA